MSDAAIWMRHGTCRDGLHQPPIHARPDSQLTHVGAAQAGLAAADLRRLPVRPNLVVSSTLRRAVETATVVATVLHAATAAPAPAFDEWRAPDCVLGLASERYPDPYVRWRQQRDLRPNSALPGGESIREFAERAAEAAGLAQELAIEHGAIVIVSHRLLIGAVAGLNQGIRNPAHLFRFATEFPLAPAGRWRPKR